MHLPKARRVLCAIILLCSFALQAQSKMSSANYSIYLENFTAAGSSTMMTSSDYSVSGGVMGQIGYSTSSSAKYTVKGGLLSASSLASGDISTVYAYPNPFKSVRGAQNITFTNMTITATIQIYTISGELVRTLTKNDNYNNSSWDIHNESGMRVASGLYIYVITSGAMRKTGKIIVIW